MHLPFLLQRDAALHCQQQQNLRDNSIIMVNPQQVQGQQDREVAAAGEEVDNIGEVLRSEARRVVANAGVLAAAAAAAVEVRSNPQDAAAASTLQALQAIGRDDEDARRSAEEDSDDDNSSSIPSLVDPDEGYDPFWFPPNYTGGCIDCSPQPYLIRDYDYAQNMPLPSPLKVVHIGDLARSLANCARREL